MSPQSRMRSVGWFVVLTVCVALFAGLTFKVNAVKSQVRLAERRIVALEREKMMLETEFQTRANQQQLDEWNEVEFGYVAPDAGQFIDNERELARLGAPRAPGAPEPIRVASAVEDSPVEGDFPQLVSPLTGRALAAELPRHSARPERGFENLSAQIGRAATRIAIPGGEVSE